jgi:hypothetical protein
MSCQASKQEGIPSFYLSQAQNNSSYFYGSAEGYSLEEATKFALSEAASRLVVSISSTSELLREENNFSSNEEIRQKVSQNVANIDFTGFRVSKSANFQNKFYVEVEIPRDVFLSTQKENAEFLKKKISNLEEGIDEKNPIQKRNNLKKILENAKRLELISLVFQGAGEKSILKDTLKIIAETEKKLSTASDKISFYFSENSKISSVIKNFLNNEKISISSNKSKKDQIEISINEEVESQEIYGSFITKIKIDFENKVDGKTIASKKIEVSGSSAIGKKESYSSAVEVLKQRVERDGVLKIIGIE